MSRWILGFSGLYHDSAAALVHDGEVIAAVQEERFTRQKHDARFPKSALDFCIGRLPPGTPLDAIVFYEDPVLHLDRVIKNSIERAPRGGEIWPDVARKALGEKLHVAGKARAYVDTDDKVLVAEHHLSHAASAYYPSPFDHAAILVVDGVGEWATTSIAHGTGSEVHLLSEVRYPHSLGLLYSAFTEYCGLRVNSGEYKLMGLAPYGEPTYCDVILDRLMDLKPDGSFRLDTAYFGYLDTGRATNAAFHELFGGPPLSFGETPRRRHMDIAASIQVVINDAMTKLARTALETTGEKNLCLAGGVALNCVSNGRLQHSVPELSNLWIQPAAGDAGGALGAALLAAHGHFELPRPARPRNLDSQRGSLLGTRWSAEDVEQSLRTAGLVYHHFQARISLQETIARALAQGQVIGYFDGAMEFGPRALGSRSILADPRRNDIQRRLNREIKFREGWRPFAPAILAHRANEIFELGCESPYMLLVAPLRAEYRETIDWQPFRDGDIDLFTFAEQRRSRYPGITHVDYSARIQTVDADRNPGFYNLLSAFERETGCPMLVNTSFNIRGEPIVSSPEEAIDCFLRSGLDGVAMGDFVAWKNEQRQEHRALEGRFDAKLD